MRFAALIGALLLYGWGELLTVRANVGLGPWDVLHQAVSIHTGCASASATVIVSFVVLVLAAALGERPGIGTAAQRADRRLGRSTSSIASTSRRICTAASAGARARRLRHRS